MYRPNFCFLSIFISRFIILTKYSNSMAYSYIITISDMKCDQCSGAITKRLSELTGLKDVAASLDDKTVRVELAEENGILKDELRAVLDEMGYEVTEIIDGGATVAVDEKSCQPDVYEMDEADRGVDEADRGVVHEISSEMIQIEVSTIQYFKF